jgi:hypothetical protein
LIEFPFLDEADGLDIGNSLNGPAGHDICLINRGTGHEKIHAGRIGLLEQHDIGAAPADKADIEIGKPVGESILLGEDSDIMVLAEMPRCHVACFCDAIYQDFHFLILKKESGDIARRRLGEILSRSRSLPATADSSKISGSHAFALFSELPVISHIYYCLP